MDTDNLICTTCVDLKDELSDAGDTYLTTLRTRDIMIEELRASLAQERSRALDVNKKAICMETTEKSLRSQLSEAIAHSEYSAERLQASLVEREHVSSLAQEYQQEVREQSTFEHFLNMSLNRQIEALEVAKEQLQVKEEALLDAQERARAAQNEQKVLADQVSALGNNIQELEDHGAKLETRIRAYEANEIDMQQKNHARLVKLVKRLKNQQLALDTARRDAARRDAAREPPYGEMMAELKQRRSEMKGDVERMARLKLRFSELLKQRQGQLDCARSEFHECQRQLKYCRSQLDQPREEVVNDSDKDIALIEYRSELESYRAELIESQRQLGESRACSTEYEVMADRSQGRISELEAALTKLNTGKALGGLMPSSSKVRDVVSSGNTKCRSVKSKTNRLERCNFRCVEGKQYCYRHIGARNVVDFDTVASCPLTTGT